MIQVKYWPRELRLTVEGHATNENMEGNPDVCSAASILAYSLMNTLDGMNDRRWAKCVYFDNGDGLAYMRANKPKRFKFKAVRVAFGMTFGGFGLLQQCYPDLVRCEVCTGKPFDDKAAIRAVLEKNEKTPL